MDRILIHGYLKGLSRPEQVVHFVPQVLGFPLVSKEVLSPRTHDYQNWLEAFACNPGIPMEWAGKGVRKEDYVLPALRRMMKKNAFGVYFIFQSMEQGRTFRSSMPKYPTQDPNYRILAHPTSRFTHYYFYIRAEGLGPILVRRASFFPCHATYWLNGPSCIAGELIRGGIGFRKDDNAFLAVDDVAALPAAAHRLRPHSIGKQLDYWTLILGILKEGTQPAEPLALLRHHADRVRPKLYLPTSLSDSQNLRAGLRNRSVAMDRPPHPRDFRRTAHQQAARPARHRPRTDRPRPPRLAGPTSKAPCSASRRSSPASCAWNGDPTTGTISA